MVKFVRIGDFVTFLLVPVLMADLLLNILLTVTPSGYGLTFLLGPMPTTNLKMTIIILTITPSGYGLTLLLSSVLGADIYLITITPRGYGWWRGFPVLLHVGQKHSALLAPTAAVRLDVAIPVIANTNAIITSGGCSTSSNTFISVCPP